MKQAVILALASMGFGAAVTLMLTKPPVFLYFLAKLFALVR